MGDLISRESLLKKAEYHAAPFEDILCVTYDDVLNAPSVDAVEVIRCKDCKYASMTNGGECKYCKQWETEEALYLDGNFFCAWGERREENETD